MREQEIIDLPRQNFKLFKPGSRPIFITSHAECKASLPKYNHYHFQHYMFYNTQYLETVSNTVTCFWQDLSVIPILRITLQLISQSELQYAREVFKQTKMLRKSFNSVMRHTCILVNLNGRNIEQCLRRRIFINSISVYVTCHWI